MSGSLAAALRIVVLLLSSRTPDPALESLQNAALQALGPDAQVQVVALPRAPNEQQTQAYSEQAEGLVQVEWSSDRRHVTLYIYSSAEGTRSQRAVQFDANDAESDKGSHLGFLIGSLFDAAPSPAPAPATSEPTAQASPAATPQKSAAATMQHPARARDAAPSEPADAKSASHELSSAWLFEATLSTALRDAGGGFGANLGFRTRLGSVLWWHLGAGAQGGEVPAAQATTKTVRAATGVEWTLAVGSRFELGPRAEVLANWLQVAHLSADDPAPDRKQRWNAGAALLLSAGLHLSQSSAIVLSSGLELLLGETRLYTHGQEVATLGRARWLTNVGFRVAY